MSISVEPFKASMAEKLLYFLSCFLGCLRTFSVFVYSINLTGFRRESLCGWNPKIPGLFVNFAETRNSKKTSCAIVAVKTWPALVIQNYLILGNILSHKLYEKWNLYGFSLCNVDNVLVYYQIILPQIEILYNHLLSSCSKKTEINK